MIGSNSIVLKLAGTGRFSFFFFELEHSLKML